MARGVLDERRHKTLGLFTSTRYPELDPGPETELRARLRRVLVDGAETRTPRTTALLGLLVPLDLVKRVVERDERKAAQARVRRRWPNAARWATPFRPRSRSRSWRR